MHATTILCVRKNGKVVSERYDRTVIRGGQEPPFDEAVFRRFERSVSGKRISGLWAGRVGLRLGPWAWTSYCYLGCLIFGMENFFKRGLHVTHPELSGSSSLPRCDLHHVTSSTSFEMSSI